MKDIINIITESSHSRWDMEDLRDRIQDEFMLCKNENDVEELFSLIADAIDFSIQDSPEDIAKIIEKCANKRNLP